LNEPLIRLINLDDVIDLFHLDFKDDKGKLILEKQGLDYLKTPIIEGNISKITKPINLTI